MYGCMLSCSSANLHDEEQISEFWSRDGGASGPEEDISDADGMPQT